MVAALATPSESPDLREAYQQAVEIRARLARQDPAAFRAFLRVDADGTPKLLGESIDAWQGRDFASLDHGWKWVVGVSDASGKIRGYLERPRGHSKTTDIAAMALWAVFASRRKLVGYAAASDKDQAKLIRDAIDGIVRINPWLRNLVDVQNFEVVNRLTNSRLTIIASDAPGSYGYTPDFVIIDELTHWKKRDLWDSLFSAAAKRERCMLVVIANAGMGKGSAAEEGEDGVSLGGSWQWGVREACRTDPDWVFSRLDGPKASWITRKRLDEQRRMLPRAAYRRLWLNIWTAGEGDALDPDDIEAAITIPSAMISRDHHNRLRPPGSGMWQFLAGLDLGVNHDHAALVVLGMQSGSPRLRLAHCQSWKPGESGQVDLAAVMQGVRDAHRRFFLSKLLYDPHQAVLMAQTLGREGLLTEPMNFVGQNLNLMATRLLAVFRTRIIDLYRASELVRDLSRLTIMEKPWGFKLESARTEDGHADTAIALAICLPAAEELAHRGAFESATPTAMKIDPSPKRHGVNFQRHGINGHKANGRAAR